MSNIKNLTAEQRIDMISKGLSPLNESHVSTYLQNNGRIKASKEDLVERAKILIGAENLNKNLGHSSDYGSSSMSEVNNLSSPQDLKQIIAKDMESYGSFSSEPIDFSPQLKMNLLKENAQSVPKKQKVTVESLEKEGYSNGIEYLNSFILNLKQPSSKSRINLYKSLGNLLKKEQQFTNTNAKQAFLKGVVRAENEMLKKLKG